MVWFRRRLINNRTPAFIGLVCLCSLFLLTRYGTYVTQRLSVEESTETVNYRDIPAKDNFQRGQINENVVKRGKKGVKSVKWTYRCDKSRKACIRREASESEEQIALDVCYLTCGSYGSVWPYPKTHLRGSQTVKFYPENLHLVDVQAKTEGVRRMIQEAFEIKHEYLKNLPEFKYIYGFQSPGLNPKRIKDKSSFWSFFNFFGSKKANDVSTTEVHVSIFTLESDEVFTLNMDESYEIKIQADQSEGITIIEVIIIGDTFFGVRHGIETLSQLIALDDINLCLQIINQYTANDEPHYPYRGILIDTARNFLPLHLVKRVIDGMALNKLNILHMHLTDSNTFPFYSERVPQLTEYGSLSPDQIYYPHQLKDLVQYARIRGVKIIPELDAPAHAGNGWQFGRRHGLRDLAFQINLYDSSWPTVCGQPPCGFLNIANPNTYLLLEDLYADMLDIFDKDLFHMGGDEVNLDSWKVIPDLKNWHNVTSMMDLWKLFQKEAHKRLKKHSANVTAILWTSHLTSEKDILHVLKPEDYIIQLWDTSKEKIESFLRKRYRVILSTTDKFYLDHGAGTWLGKNHEWVYKNWQVLYDSNRIDFRHLEDTDEPGRKLLLGAEATLWGEKVGPDDVETKLWPRSSALAESFWSNPAQRDQETYTRINYHNRRFRQYKIPTSQMQPDSCLHFYGNCETPGQHWFQRRKLITPSFHFAILESFVAPINSHARTLVDILHKNFVVENPNKFLDIYPFVAKCGLDAICETAMGIKLNAQTDSGSGQSSEYVKAVRRMGELFQYRSIRPWIRNQFTWKLTAKGREEGECLKMLHSFTNKIIADRKRLLETSGVSNSSTDLHADIYAQGKVKQALLDWLVNTQKSEESISDAGIREEIDTFVFAGHDTISVATSFCLFNIGNNPEVQEKLHEEMDTIFQENPNREITSADLREMKYLECCIKESLRLYPSVPAIGRQVTKDFRLDANTVVPSGSILYMIIYKTHRNSKYFPKPDEFIPERFATGSCLANKHTFAYIPFAAGPRNCIGQKLAMIEVKILVASILRRFRIKSQNKPEELELLSEMVLRTRGGINVSLQER